MALEASSMGSTDPTETEFKNLVKALKEKYTRYQRGLAKGKARERPDVPTDVVSGNDADDMNVG